MDNLPKLTAKEQACLLRFFSNGENQTEAYRFAYDCSNSTDKTVWENSSKFFKSTKVLPWVEYHRKNQQQVIKEEIEYTAVDAMKEYEDLQSRCRQSAKTYNVEKGCIDSKCKLAGLITEKKETRVSGLSELLDELK